MRALRQGVPQGPEGRGLSPLTSYFVIACGAAKAAAPRRARELYTGSAFRHFLGAAEAEAAATIRDLGTDAKVLILSALHGLVELDETVAPYDVKMGAPGSVSAPVLAAQLLTLGIGQDDELCAMLPKAYRELLAEAALMADELYVSDIYEAAPGIGFQRGVASSLKRSAATQL